MKTPEEIARNIIYERNTAIIPQNKEYLVREIAEAIAAERTNQQITDKWKVGLNWEVSDEAKKQIAEIKKHIKR